MDLIAHGLIAGGPVTVAYDCTGANLGHAPQDAQLAGYTTGSHGIPWTPAQFAAHPGTIRIDQTPASTQWDDDADVDDYENGAVRLDELADRAKKRIKSFLAAQRPGQRWPAVYFSASNVHNVANALVNGGVTGVGFWIADWDFTKAEAFADVINAAGPFPIVGVQYRSGQYYDTDVFSSKWLANVSRKPDPGPYRHVTGTMQTFGDLAATRNASVEGFIGRAFHGYTGADWAALAKVNIGKDFPYYTENR